jgi:hypothetical protein
VADRAAKRPTVHSDLASLGAFVQQLADADPPNPLAIIEASGFDVKGSSGHGKADFEVRQGPVSGSAAAVARAEKTRTSYDWEYGTNPAALQRAESTVRADIVIAGLTVGVLDSFRYQTVTKDGTRDWSDVVSLLVR